MLHLCPAVDFDEKKAYVGKNGDWTVIFEGLDIFNQALYPCITVAECVVDVNFGSAPFKFPGPTEEFVPVPKATSFTKIRGMDEDMAFEEMDAQAKDKNQGFKAGTGAKSPVQARFILLQRLNSALRRMLPYVDLSLVDKAWSFGALLAHCRGLILSLLKLPLWEKALLDTEVASSMFDLKLSRSKAAKFSQTSEEPDHTARYMCFSQAFRQMNSMPNSRFRPPQSTDRMYNCIFMGERSHDAGGPYRESWSQYAQELESPHMPLLLRTPNGRHSSGQNRDRWVLHPGNTSTTHRDMLAFLGKLMGIAVRTRQYMALSIAPFMWDLLVGCEPSLEALRGIDEMLVRSMDKIVHIEDEGITSDMFQYVVMETFTTLSTDDRTVEVIPGGADRDVTFEDRHEFVEKVQYYRLHEFDDQITALKRGLSCIVPTPLLSLFTGAELETMVCGSPDIDVDLLASVTEYSSCSSNDNHVRNFWQVMREFNQEERSMFLRFTWGRTRLPLNAAAFSQRFKLQAFNKSPPDQYFPVAHTCFFSLELPQYSNKEILRDKLRYAIYNCTVSPHPPPIPNMRKPLMNDSHLIFARFVVMQAIDGDDTATGMEAAAMGWEE